jgi:hypothetical protein
LLQLPLLQLHLLLQLLHLLHLLVLRLLRLDCCPPRLLLKTSGWNRTCKALPDHGCLGRAADATANG